MSTFKVNETPVRTSKNFNINNIKLNDINIPEDIKNFDNVKVIGQNDNVSISSKITEFNLTYGLGEDLTNNVIKNSNKKLKIEIDSKNNDDIEFDFTFNDENLNLLENIEIVAMESSKATVILKYISDENIEAFHNGIIRVFAEKNSDINVVIVNLMNRFSNNFMSIENKLEKDSKIKFTIIDLGGKNSITNYYSNLVGDKSENTINTIYLGSQNQLFDLNYISELRGVKSKVDIEIQGALKDTAQKHFKGTIDFKKGCKKALGNENESCMLLSDSAKSLALPMLLCSEEDVEGNHSSSAGKIGEKELFYIMSRGFELKEAMKLMVRAKFNKILENITNQELKKEILKTIDTRLD